jgi:serine/threonine protein phosphatase PrpC
MANNKVYKASLTGLRDNNEDYEYTHYNLKKKNPKYAYTDIFIICDGHSIEGSGGDIVSKVVAKKLAYKFTDKNLKFPISNKKIKKIFNDVHNELVSDYSDECADYGTTALVVIKYEYKSEYHLIAINLGDCRAFVATDTSYTVLTLDHKPTTYLERSRIAKINSELKKKDKENIEIDDDGIYRICGLSVSRSFGDLNQKPFISHEPCTTRYTITEDTTLIVMACDGLWDVMKEDEVLNFINDWRNGNDMSFYSDQFTDSTSQDIATLLAEYAIILGSTDNVSVIIVNFFD